MQRHSGKYGSKFTLTQAPTRNGYHRNTIHTLADCMTALRVKELQDDSVRRIDIPYVLNTKRKYTLRKPVKRHPRLLKVSSPHQPFPP